MVDDTIKFVQQPTVQLLSKSGKLYYKTNDKNPKFYKLLRL